MGTGSILPCNSRNRKERKTRTRINESEFDSWTLYQKKILPSYVVLSAGTVSRKEKIVIVVGS